LSHLDISTKKFSINFAVIVAVIAVAVAVAVTIAVAVAVAVNRRKCYNTDDLSPLKSILPSDPL
jgi:hypothetical protein